MKIPKTKEIWDFVFNLPLIVNIVNWSKEHSLPGFFSVPIYDVVAFILNEIKRNTLITRANSIAFSFFLSIFPALLFLFTLIPFILPYFDFLIIPYLPDDQVVSSNGIVNFSQTIVKVIETNIDSLEILPSNVKLPLVTFLKEITTTVRPGQLYFVLILTLFFSSNGMMSLFKGFEKSYKSTFKRRTVIKKRLVAILLTFILGILVLVSAFSIVLTSTPVKYVLNYIDADRFSGFVLGALSWLLVISLFYFGISIIYRYGAATFRRFSWFSPGTTLATTLSILSLLGFSFYVDHFSSYNELYGSIGSIIVIMLWIQINAFFLLLGFELNASIAVNRDLKIAKEED